MFKCLHISILNLLATTLIQVTCYGNNNTDSLEQVLQNTLKAEKRIELLFAITQQKLEQEDHHCLIYAEEALHIADSIKSKKLQAKASYLSGLAWKMCNDNSTAIIKLYNAADLYCKLGNRLCHAKALREIGETYRANGNLPASQKNLKEALKIQLELKDSAELAQTYNRLAATHYETFYNNKLYFEFLSNPSKEQLQYLFSQDKKFRQCFDSTILYLNLSNQFAKQFQINRIIVSNSIILGALYITVYEIEKADSTLNTALRDIEKYDLQSELPLAYYNMARLFSFQQKYEPAIEYASKCFQLAKNHDTKVYVLFSAILLSDTYKKLEKFEDALKYFRIAFDESNAYFKNDLNLKVSALEYQSEIEKRKIELIYQKAKMHYIAIFFFILLLMFSIFLIIVYRKNRQQKILNQRLRYKKGIIEEQNAKLKILNSEKDKFFSIIAHDLRGPFGAFISYTDLIVNAVELSNYEKVRYLSISMQQAANNLFNLLENLLDWSRLQRNAITFNSEICNVENIVKESARLMVDAASKKGVDIKYDIKQNLQVRTDARMLQTIMRNLISNAIKYTSSGGSVGIVATETKNYTVIKVIDTGIGMSPEIIDTIFQIDKKINRPGTDHETSTGLGMILCKEFIDKMAGSIHIESAVDKGSTITIQLPRNI